MKKKYLIILVSLIFNQVYTQNETGVISYIGANMGAAIPIGDVGIKDLNNNKTDIASPGFSSNFVHFGMIFEEKLGFNIRYFANSHPIKNGNNDQFFGYASFMFGASYSFNLFTNVYLDIIPSLGLVSSLLLTKNVASNQTSGLGYGLSSQIRYNFARKWAATVNIEYLNSSQGSNTSNNTINTLSTNGGVIYYFKAPEFNRRSGGGF